MSCVGRAAAHRFAVVDDAPEHDGAGQNANDAPERKHLSVAQAITMTQCHNSMQRFDQDYNNNIIIVE